MVNVLDEAEIISLTSSIITLICGSILLSESTTDVWLSIASALIFFIQICFTMYLLYRVAYAIKMSNEIKERSQKHISGTELTVVGSKSLTLNPITSKHPRGKSDYV